MVISILRPCPKNSCSITYKRPDYSPSASLGTGTFITTLQAGGSKLHEVWDSDLQQVHSHSGQVLHDNIALRAMQDSDSRARFLSLPSQVLVSAHRLLDVPNQEYILVEKRVQVLHLDGPELVQASLSVPFISRDRNAPLHRLSTLHIPLLILSELHIHIQTDRGEAGANTQPVHHQHYRHGPHKDLFISIASSQMFRCQEAQETSTANSCDSCSPLPLSSSALIGFQIWSNNTHPMMEKRKVTMGHFTKLLINTYKTLPQVN